MTTKHITLTFTFEGEWEDDYLDLDLKTINRETDLTDAQIDALGEVIGQSDRWQIDHWIDIQTALGDSRTSHVNVK